MAQKDGGPRMRYQVFVAKITARELRDALIRLKCDDTTAIMLKSQDWLF